VGYVVTADGRFGGLDVGFRILQQHRTPPNVVAGLANGPGGQLYSTNMPPRRWSRIKSANWSRIERGKCRGRSSVPLAGLNDGRLFAVDFTNTLYQVDPVTGAGLLLATSDFRLWPTRWSFGNSLAGDAAGSTTRTTIRIPSHSFIHSIWRNGQRHSDRPDRTFGIGGSGFVGGTLLRLRRGNHDNQTFRLNLTTGAATLVGPYDVGGANIYGAVIGDTGTSYLGLFARLQWR